MYTYIIYLLTLVVSIHPLATYASNRQSSDFNKDDIIDIADFNTLRSSFGKKYTIFDYNNLVLDYGINFSNIGFNELFTLSHLSYIGQWRPEFSKICLSEPVCPQNMPVYPSTKAMNILRQIQTPHDGPIVRDIIPLKIIEPTPGSYPFDSEIYSMLQKYADNSTELVLSFTTPLPTWVDDDEAKIEAISQIITSFVERISKFPIDHSWLKSHLTIEPINEINASLSGDPTFSSRLDNLVRTKLNINNIPHRRVVSSSIISGNSKQYLGWYREYYQSDGTALPNIHLYVSDELDNSSFEDAMKRFESIVIALNAISPSGNVLIGEVGISSVNQSITALERNEFFHTVVSSTVMQSTDKLILWRLWRDWLSIPCTLSTCDPLTAKETTFGFINFNTGLAEEQMQRYFLDSSFSWSP